MNVDIREENPEDYPVIFNLIEKAFLSVEMSDHREQYLVERLRRSKAYIPELSLVACHKKELIGHILLTNITILNNEHTYQTLALAPVSVLPTYQNKGVGGKLIEEAHRRAAGLGYRSVVLIGHSDYYPRFGYEKASKYGISSPFKVPDENSMVIALVDDGLKGVSGVVEHAAPFME